MTELSSAEPAYSAEDMMVVAAARMLRNGTTCFVGIGLPSAAAILASQTHAPDLFFVYESGTLGPKPTHVPLSVADEMLAETARSIVSVPEIFNYWLQPGRIDVGLLGTAQVDRFGNLNSTVIGSDYTHPTLRLPGAGGAPEIASACKEVIIIVRQSVRTFVNHLDFLTSIGHGSGGDSRHRLGLIGAGPRAIVTDLGVYEPDSTTREIRLTHIQPGASLDQVRAATAWHLLIDSDLKHIAPPSAQEMEIIHYLHSTADGFR